ncbi:MAG: AN1-type zinc finger domain-containing protein [Candidatus Helarchaeota archaeon]
MTKCVKCGKEIYMPFICNYCGGAFCSDHRLPENHNCKNIGRASSPHVRAVRAEPQYPATQPEWEMAPSESEWHPTPGGRIVERYYEPDGTEVIIEEVAMYAIQKPDKPIWYFSSTELKHLALGIVMMFGVGLSMFFTVSFFQGTGYEPWWVYVALAGLATLAFLLHEFGHKFMGIRLGNWSEFRLIKIFAILTAFSIIPLNPLKIVCPGAVQVTGDTKTENMGKIAIAGPIVNLIQAGIFLLLAGLLFVQGDTIFNIFIIAAYLNAFLGVFNLIPIGPLDGRKVIRWDKLYYILVLIMLIAILIYVFPLVSL